MFKKILFTFLLFISGIVSVYAEDFTSIYFDSNEAYIDDIINVTFERNDDKEISEIKGYFMGDNYYTVIFEDADTDEPYFVIPDYFKEGKEYQLNLLNVVYEDGTDVSYPVEPITGELNSLETDSSIIKILRKPTIKKFELNGNGEFDINDSAKFNIEYTGDLDFATIIITNSDDSDDCHLLSLNIDGNIATARLSSNSPTKISPGNYYVSDLYLNPSNNGYVHYSVDDDYDSIKMKKISFKIIGESSDSNEEEIEEDIDKSIYEFNLEELDDNILKDLKKLNDDAIITVNIEKNTLVSSKIFDSIINTDRYLIIKNDDVTWEFDGKKIINPKMIDVNLKISLLTSETNDKYLSSVIKSNSVLLNFAENGKLPGEVLIKVKATIIDAIIESKKLYIYYYDEKNDKLINVESGIEKVDNEYEFVINHNSKYIVTSEKITEEKEIKTIGASKKTKSSSNLVLYIIITIGVIALTVLTIFIIKSKKKNKPSFLEDTTVISIENIETKKSSIDDDKKN